MSHELLDDLLANVPRHVVPDLDRAWRAGTARRRRRYAAEALAVAVVVALVGIGLVRLQDHNPVIPANSSDRVSGHPTQVPRPWRQQAVPDRPGPLAGAIEVTGRWSGVDQNGRSWRLPTAPDYFPALSPDGNQLGQLVADSRGRASYETVDLTTGEHTTYDDVGDGSSSAGKQTTDQPYWAAEQQPSYWSPDGRRLLLRGGRVDTKAANDLLLEDGLVRVLAVQGFPVGWVSPTAIAWLAFSGDRVRITDLDGTVVREVELFPNEPLRGLSQWSGRVSPDGTRLAVRDRVDRGQPRIWTFSLLDGSADPDTPTQPADPGYPTCPLMWHGDRVAVWAFDGLRDLPSNHTVIEPRGWGDSTCGTWADAALAGPAQPGVGVLEWRYWPVEQNWPWLLGVIVGGGVAAGLWWVRRRRRRVSTPAS
jgi:hypothetical protein